MKPYLMLALLVVGHFKIESQIKCEGLLLDSVTKEGIEFANIGILGKGFGTVSNEKGAYILVIPDTLQDALVKVSMIGYKTRSIKVLDLSKTGKILLAPALVNLNEVVVKPKQNKTKILGNATRGAISGGFNRNSLGAELGVRLNIKYPNTQLKKFMVNINSNSLSQFPVFRLNVYSVGKNGLPNENLLKQNIIIEPKEKVGFVEFDLTPYSIYADDDVFVSLEWIKDLGDVKGLFFSTKLIGGATYFRQTSQDKWEKVSAIGIGLHVEVGY